jgi:hypothetical protein
MSWRDSQQRLVGMGYPISVDGAPGPQTYGALFAYMGAKANAAMLGQSCGRSLPGLSDRHAACGWRTGWRSSAHESSGFTKFVEDLRYSAPRLCAVWPKRFPTLASAQPYRQQSRGAGEQGLWRAHGQRPARRRVAVSSAAGRSLTGRDNYSASASSHRPRPGEPSRARGQAGELRPHRLRLLGAALLQHARRPRRPAAGLTSRHQRRDGSASTERRAHCWRRPSGCWREVAPRPRIPRPPR